MDETLRTWISGKKAVEWRIMENLSDDICLKKTVSRKFD